MLLLQSSLPCSWSLLIVQIWNLVQVIEEDITKFHIRSHFLPFMKEKYHNTTKRAKVNLMPVHRIYMELYIHGTQWGFFFLTYSTFYFAGCFKLTIQCQHRSCETTTPNGGYFLCCGAYASGLNQLLFSLSMANVANS